jgi:hypothetical protein
MNINNRIDVFANRRGSIDLWALESEYLTLKSNQKMKVLTKGAASKLFKGPIGIQLSETIRY